MHITNEILAKLFKTSIFEINKHCSKKLKKKIIFKYLSEKEKEQLVIRILKKIKTDKQKIGTAARKIAWQKGWSETLKSFKKKNNEYSLIPKFYSERENKIFRLGGKFVKVKDEKFEIKMINLYRHWYFKKYFSLVDNIYEFGAGTGHNLFEFSKIFPKKKLFGSDFVNSSIKILKLINKKNLNIKGYIFDMTKPDKRIRIQKNSAVYTSGAIEQLAGKIEKFIKY